MFKFLSATRPERTANIASQAIRLIEWRSMLPDDLSESGVWLADELSPEERRLTLGIVEEIEELEKTSLSNISELAANKYLLKLSEIASNRINDTLSPVDVDRGRQILQKWKYEPIIVEGEHFRLPGKIITGYVSKEMQTGKDAGITPSSIKITFSKDKDRALQSSVEAQKQRSKKFPKMKRLDLYTSAELRRVALELTRKLSKTRSAKTTSGENRRQDLQSLQRIKSAIRQRLKQEESKKD